jgi:hypothetical protein
MNPVPIISDAAMMTRGIADGRLLPLIILDTSGRPDIEDMIRAHEHFGPGDVHTYWVAPSRFDRSRVRLVLKVTKPSQCVVVLEFEIVRQGVIVEQIIQSQGLYIQDGRPGDRLRTTFDHQRILAEVPSREFRPEWDRMLRKALVKDGRRRGLSRGDAKDATDRFLAEWRDLTSRRMKSEHDEPIDSEPEKE